MPLVSIHNRAVIAILLTVILSGCGYHNPYLTQGLTPITISRSMWSNHTTEIGLPNTLLQAQSDWLRKSPLITISDNKAEADYQLSGSIDRVSYPEISFGTHREGTEGRAELTVSFTLTESKSGKVVWERSAATRQKTFFMSQDPIRLQDNRTAALAEIADDFAEEIYLHLITTTMRPTPAP